MKIPLTAILSPKTRDLRTGELKALITRNGRKEGVVVPYKPYYYVLDERGESYTCTGRPESIKLSKVHYKPGDIIPPNALFDGGREHLLDRLCIEHPEFFNNYPNDEPVKSLCFDIETHSPDGSFPFGEKYPIVAIGIATSEGKEEVLVWEEENDKQLLLDFAECIRKHNPDIIYGYNLTGYDIPQILHRANFHGLTEYKKLLNRDVSTFGWEQYSIGDKRKTELKMKAGGRIILDLLRWTRLDYSLSGLPRGLKSVSRAFGLKPIELELSIKNILDYSKEEIDEYVMSDVYCTKYLFEHYYPQIEYTAEILGVPLDVYVNAPVSYITKILQGRALFKKGTVSFDFNKERHSDIFSSDRGNFQAAHIELYKPGFQQHNYKVDFTSMYPSIAMALNLGPDTTCFVDSEEYKNEITCETGEKETFIYVPDSIINKRLKVRVDLSKKSCLYNMSKRFNEMREPYKKLKTKEAKSKSNALKIMVNTFYGANTNPYMAYGDLSVGITITAVARWLIQTAAQLIRTQKGEDSVIYIHTDGINTNVDINISWLNNRLKQLMRLQFPNCEPEWIKVEKEKYREGVWLQIGNYVLRNEDGSITKHGSTFKSRARSIFYIKILDRLIDARLNNTITPNFIDKLYSLEEYELDDFLQRRSMNMPYEDYKNENDLMVQLIRQGLDIGITPIVGNTYSYFKTKDGYRISQIVKNKSDIDVRYHWNIISSLLQKFKLDEWVKKDPPLTIIDDKQRSLMDYI